MYMNPRIFEAIEKKSKQPLRQAPSTKVETEQQRRQFEIETRTTHARVQAEIGEFLEATGNNGFAPRHMFELIRIAVPDGTYSIGLDPQWKNKTNVPRYNAGFIFRPSSESDPYVSLWSTGDYPDANPGIMLSVELQGSDQPKIALSTNNWSPNFNPAVLGLADQVLDNFHRDWQAALSAQSA